MVKPRGIDAKLRLLRAIRTASDTAVDRQYLRQCLGDASSFVVADAAAIVGERSLSDLEEDLKRAFERFMIDPEDTDPNCRAKIAISTSLNALDSQDERPFLSGIAHVQNPGFPPFQNEDAAAPLRANCGFALVRLHHPKMMYLLTDLLRDRSKVARAAAAEALGASRSHAAVPLLRFKALTGDAEADVVATCLDALLDIDPENSVAFAAGFLRHGDGIAEGAAIALGESRRPDALDILIKHWSRPHSESMTEALPLAIALTRLPAALEFLLAELGMAKLDLAKAILSALVIHRHNDVVRSRIERVVEDKRDAALVQRFVAKFAKE